MIHARYAVIMLLALDLACSDLPSHDDPRTAPVTDAGPDAESGKCAGDYIPCDYRAVSQCNGGCELETACYNTMTEQCATIRSPDACDSNPLCRWSSLGVCALDAGGVCSIYLSQTACNGPSADEDCAWGSTCGGSPDSCSQVKTKTACTAAFGCTWTPSR